MVAEVRSWIGTVVIDCKEFDAMVKFWKDALGYEQRGPRDEGWTLLYDPKGAGPNLAFRRDEEAPGAFWWFHLDLYSSAPDAELQRLVGLGAKLVEPKKADTDFATLSDPDGNLFDIVEKGEFKFGQRRESAG